MSTETPKLQIDREGMGEVMAVRFGDGGLWTYARHIDQGPGDAPEPVVQALIGAIDNLRRERDSQNNVLTADTVHRETGFSLVATFTGFSANNGEVSPDLHDERERFSDQYGEDNVMPSFFIDDNGELQLGLFIRMKE